MVQGTTAGLLGIILLATFVRAGDRDVAEFLCDKAEKALRAKDYEGAAADFRRAREEATPYPEAAYGLGAALEKLGREVEAISAYRTCLAEVEAADKPSSKWRSTARRAASAIKRLRKRFAELDELTNDCIARCLAFARERVKSDPRWAAEAYRAVLRLDPTNGEARRGVERATEEAPAPTPPAEEEKKAPPAPKGDLLIRNAELTRWTPGVKGPWTCADGIVCCDGVGRSGHINWINDAPLRGKFELRAHVRIAVDRGERRAIGFFVGDGKSHWYGTIMESDDSVTLVESKGDQDIALESGIPRSFDATKWNVWRIVVDGRELQLFLGDQKVLEYRAREDIGGIPGLFVQSARVEFKQIEVLR